MSLNSGKCEITAVVNKHCEFVSSSVSELVDVGSAMEVNKDFLQFCSPLGVVEGSTKLRLILDMRKLNESIVKKKFKLEDMRTATKLYKKGDYVVTFDLKSGYHHVDVAQEHWKYLGFEWNSKYLLF